MGGEVELKLLAPPAAMAEVEEFWDVSATPVLVVR
jgi:hypothetical protein